MIHNKNCTTTKVRFKGSHKGNCLYLKKIKLGVESHFSFDQQKGNQNYLVLYICKLEELFFFQKRNLLSFTFNLSR